MLAVRRVAGAQVRAYDPEGLNLIQNNGVVAGQEAPHFHMHVVPRRREGSNWGSGPPHIAVHWKARSRSSLLAPTVSHSKRSIRSPRSSGGGWKPNAKNLWQPGQDSNLS